MQRLISYNGNKKDDDGDGAIFTIIAFIMVTVSNIIMMMMTVEKSLSLFHFMAKSWLAIRYGSRKLENLGNLLSSLQLSHPLLCLW